MAGQRRGVVQRNVVSGGPQPTAVPIPLYEASSQIRHWRYSKQGLEQIRSNLNAQATERVRQNVEAERAQHQTAGSKPSNEGPASGSASEPTSAAPTPPPASEIEYLTVQDEQSLVQYYLTQVAMLCGAFKFPEMVQATAMTYLKRFYLRNTCMDYHPKNIMLTCVFLASKTENYPISIDSFAARTKTTPNDVLSHEFLVSQSLRFEYKVHHAHLAASGLLLDMQTAGKNGQSGIAVETLETVYAAARAHLRTARLTDLELVYSPSQIALATFRLSNPSIVDQWLGHKAARIKDKDKAGDKGANRDSVGVEQDKAKNEGSTALTGTTKLETDRLVDVLAEIGETILEAKEHPVDKALVTQVDKRLKWARNPEKDPTSALFKKRKAQEEAERETRAQAKAAARPPPTNDGDVFN